MIFLARTVRFSINQSDAGLVGDADTNGYAGIPAPRGLCRYYEFDVVCRGEVHPKTGYFMDIKSIDRAVRQHVVPIIARACRVAPETEPMTLLAEIIRATNPALRNTMHDVTWRLTPFYSVSMSVNDLNIAVLRQRFEIAAAHRLNVDELTAEENRTIFGRCNNPSGHGHNYVIEPAVEVRLDRRGESSLDLPTLERIVSRHVVEPFDHLHLNVDTSEFDTKRGGVNPSVEQISRIFYERLARPIADAGAKLREVTVWETEKTRATYPG